MVCGFENISVVNLSKYIVQGICIYCKVPQVNVSLQILDYKCVKEIEQPGNYTCSQLWVLVLSSWL